MEDVHMGHVNMTFLVLSHVQMGLLQTQGVSWVTLLWPADAPSELHVLYGGHTL